jgi:hypothetical protein
VAHEGQLIAAPREAAAVQGLFPDARQGCAPLARSTPRSKRTQANASRAAHGAQAARCSMSTSRPRSSRVKFGRPSLPRPFIVETASPSRAQHLAAVGRLLA